MERKENVDNNNNNDNIVSNVANNDSNSQSNIIFEILRTQWYIIKNNQRKQLTHGNLQIISHPSENNIAVFHFSNNPNLSYVLCKNSPVMKTCDRNYIFLAQDDSFGLYIDGTIEEDIIKNFEQIIEQYSILKISNKNIIIHQLENNDELQVGPPDKVALLGIKLAEYIRNGTVVLTKGIRKGTLFAIEGINKGKDKLITTLQPEETPLQLSNQVKGNIVKAKLAGDAVVKVSGAILTGALAAANIISNEISNEISKTSIGQSIANNNGPKTVATKEIVKSTVSGIVTLYDEVVNASLHVIHETGNATANVIEHKYGKDAGSAAKQASHIVDSTAHTFVNVNSLGISTLAKRVAANTTVDVLSDENERKLNQNNRVRIDPITGMQALMAATSMSNINNQIYNKNKQERLQYIGLQPNVDNNDNNNNNNNVGENFIPDNSNLNNFHNNSNVVNPNIENPPLIPLNDDILDVD